MSIISRIPAAILFSTVLGIAAVATTASAVEPTASVPEAKGWKISTVLKGLEHPWGMAFLPNGDILVTERPGRIRLIKEGKLVEEPIEGVPKVFASGQGGLLDIILHPKFEENKYIYFTYAKGDSDANHTVLARAKFDGTRLSDVKEIFKGNKMKPGGQHFGSVLAWLPDGTLLMSIGDGGNPPVKVDGMLARHQAQNLASHNGSVVRLNDDGSVPKDNPFVGKEGAAPEIWSYGHRNIQGIAVDKATSTTWTTEHGPRGGDELNLTEAGKNYGWPKASFGREYRTNELVSPHTSLPGMVDPLIVWTPVTAASGLAFYTGDKFPGWKGDLFSGGLVSQDVRRIDLENNKVVKQEGIPIGQRVRMVVQGPDDLLYVLTDQQDGELIRIEPAE